MSQFPPLRPSARTFTAGSIPIGTYRSVSGKETRVMLGDTPTQHRVTLQYRNVQEAAVQSLMNHWAAQKGIALSFTLPTAVWAGWGEYKSGVPESQQWRYEAAPVVTGNAPSIMSVSVNLVSVA